MVRAWGFLLIALLADDLTADELAPIGPGSIEGWVVNESHEPRPVDGTKVILRVRLHGQFVPVEEATTDSEGRFVFDRLPVGDDILYLPGANVDGVHYPGARVDLSTVRPHARVKLVVFDSMESPSPLVAQRHDIVVESDSGVLTITESIVVSNPTSESYVGRADREGTAPVTMRLAIPDEFQRATFHEEFFGRQFAVRNGEVVTSIPWPPGEREIKLTYVISNDQRHRVLERRLDLLCSQVRVVVRTDDHEQVTCNLPLADNGQPGQKCFESKSALSAGRVIRLELGELPVSLGGYARWTAVAVLLTLLAGVGYWTTKASC